MASDLGSKFGYIEGCVPGFLQLFQVNTGIIPLKITIFSFHILPNSSLSIMFIYAQEISSYACSEFQRYLYLVLLIRLPPSRMEPVT
jgi:hypothetical protein